MDSGVVELKEVIQNLLHSGFDSTHGSGPGDYASMISNMFRGTNGALTAGWDAVSDFFNSIYQAIEENLITLREVVGRYVDMTMENEKKEEAALSAANERTVAILSEMGIE